MRRRPDSSSAQVAPGQSVKNDTLNANPSKKAFNASMPQLHLIRLLAINLELALLLASCVGQAGCYVNIAIQLVVYKR